MSQAAMPAQTTTGYTPPRVTQFSVFLDNRVGRLFDMVRAFDGSGCQICALSVAEASDHAVIRLITSSSKSARQILKDSKATFSERDVLVVELSKGHTISSLCLSLLGAEINIHFAYALMLRPNGTPTIALSVDDTDLAGQVLRRKNFRLYGEADISDPH